MIKHVDAFAAATSETRRTHGATLGAALINQQGIRFDDL